MEASNEELIHQAKSGEIIALEALIQRIQKNMKFWKSKLKGGRL